MRTRTNHPCLPKWRKRIAAAIVCGHFTDSDAKRASQWDQCACGEARKAYPELVSRRRPFPGNLFWVPRDQRLRTLGLKFSCVVENQDMVAALECLQQIETRLHELDEEARS